MGVGKVGTKVSLPHCSDCLSSNRPRAQSPGCRCESLSGIATRFPIRESWPVANPCPGLRGLSLSGTLQIPFRDCSRVPYPGTVPRCNSLSGFARAVPIRDCRIRTMIPYLGKHTSRESFAGTGGRIHWPGATSQP